MMTEEGLINNSGRDLKYFLLFLVILGFIWFVQGGAKNLPEGPLIKERTIAGEIKEPPQDSVEQASQGGSVRQIEEKINISFSASKARETDPQKEYIEIRNNDESAVDISGWTIKGKNTFELKIPKATPLYIANKVNLKQDIILKPRDKAIIITGQSPIGYSFYLNKCMGYFSWHQTYYPSISTYSCPNPKDEEWPNNLSDDCLDYIEKLPRCQANTVHPFYLGNDCITTINNMSGYNKCVELHKNDKDFYKKEWRIYLGRSEELWKSQRETITLRDQLGNIIKEVSYK